MDRPTMRALVRSGTALPTVCARDLLLALAVVSAASGASEARAMALGPSPSQEVPDVPEALRVTVDSEIADAEEVPGWLGQRNTDVDAALELPAHEQWIAVTIGGTTYDFEVTVTPMRDGAPVGEASEVLRCECNHAEMMELVDKRIDAAVAVLQSTPPPKKVIGPPKKTPGPKEATMPPEETIDGTSSLTKPNPLTRLGIAGIVGTSLGVVTLGTGVGLVLAPSSVVSDYSSYLVRDYRPAGYAALSVGIVATGAGVALLAIDRTRCKRNAAARDCSSTSALERPRRLHGSGFVSQTRAGFSIAGRF